MAKTLIISGCIALIGMLFVVPKALVWADDAAQPAKATFIGSAVCKGCHGKIYQPWMDTKHGKSLTQEGLPAELTGCEACHGPGSLHAGSGGKNKPPIPSADNPAATNTTCGACHFQQDGVTAPTGTPQFSKADFVESQHGRKALSCLSCHTGHATADKALRKPTTELCASCHASIQETTPGKKADYTHFPAAEGMCLKCHDPHGTPGGRMVVKDITKVCAECHDTGDAAFTAAHKQMADANTNCLSCHDVHSHNRENHLLRPQQHKPFQLGMCSACHVKNDQGQTTAELVKPKDQLCLSCHPASKMMPAGEKAHPPVKAGLCLACHDPHASDQKALLKNRQADLCFTCHKKIEKDTLSPHKHKILEETMNCTLCHKPHSSANDHLMVKDYQSLCGQCHKHSFSHPMFTKKDGTPVLVPNTDKVLTCASCHDLHGGEYEALTKGSKNRDLCLNCHTVEH